MSLQKELMVKMKEAMKSKDTVALESLRAIKSEILLAQTKGGAASELTKDDEIKLLQKLVKQRKDSAETYQKAGRTELFEKEVAEVAYIEVYLPTQLSEDELTAMINKVIEETIYTSCFFSHLHKAAINRQRQIYRQIARQRQTEKERYI